MGSQWGDVSGSNESGRRPHKESFAEWMDSMHSEDPYWHNDDIHVIWRPPPRCITCGGHRITSMRGRRPIETRRLGFWAWLAELPMRWLALSLRNKDSRTWTMEEQLPPMTFGTHIHEQIHKHLRTLNDEQDNSA